MKSKAEKDKAQTVEKRERGGRETLRMRISLSSKREALTMSSVVMFTSWSSSRLVSSTIALAISNCTLLDSIRDARKSGKNRRGNNRSVQSVVLKNTPLVLFCLISLSCSLVLFVLSPFWVYDYDYDGELWAQQFKSPSLVLGSRLLN